VLIYVHGNEHDVHLDLFEIGEGSMRVGNGSLAAVAALAIGLGTITFMATQSYAIVFDLNDPYDGSADASDLLFVGRIVDGAPSSPAHEAAYINTLTTLLPGALPTLIPTETYDRLSSTHLGPFAAAGVDANKQDNTNTFLAGEYQYILIKYGGFSLVWHDANGIGDGMGVNLLARADNSGLSHSSGHNNVPDGDVTLALLGLSLLGVGGVRRSLKRKKS
jgi:hypothetical protein